MLSADWSTKIISVPKSDLSLISGTRYEITVDFWFELLRILNATAQGIVETVNAPLYKNTSPTTTTPRIVDVINGYTVTFEVGAYSVEFVDGNTNLREVENKNIVSVGTNNTSALINPTVLEAGVYAGRIAIDAVNGVAGVGKTPQGELIGTLRAPSNNMNDAIEIAGIQGVKDFLFLGNMTINEDLSEGFNLIGGSQFFAITCNTVADLSTCSMTNMTLIGELDGLNSIRDCAVGGVTKASGLFSRCLFTAEVEMVADVVAMECYSNIPGTGQPTISITSGNLMVRDFHGSIEITNCTGGVHSVSVSSGGRIVIASTCTGGEIHLRGMPFEIVDNSGAGCTVIIETDSHRITELPARILDEVAP